MMSQTAFSRPGTQQSLGGGRGAMLTLPEIAHPLSRLGSPEKLGVRGMSRAGSDRLVVDHGGGRPLSQEPGLGSGRKYRSSAGRDSRLSQSDPNPSFRYQQPIPEGVAVVQGDPNSTRMPLFGSRAGLGTRDGLNSRCSTASQSRLEIDELEAILKQKVKNNHHEVKKRFRDNDPEQTGNVSKDALARIIATLIGKPVSPTQFSRLMDRMGLKDRNIVSFNDFDAAFGERIVSGDMARWVDPIQRQWQEKTNMSAAQVHMHLKQKAKQRVHDIVDLIPQSKPDGTGNVLKAEFRNTLNTMGFTMEDAEFSKLWDRYDPSGIGIVNGLKMMEQLGVEITDGEVGDTPGGDIDMTPVTSMKRTEVQRKQMLDVERWLKNKFREGFSTMKSTFEQRDPRKTGEVSFDDFLSVLRESNLKLEKSYLSDFLARCRIIPSQHGIPYREFLHRFQDRSDEGMAHNILTNVAHKYNRAESPTNKSTLSSLETQLLNMFQNDFLALLGMFHKIDFGGTDRISQEEFRAAIESRFSFDMTDDQFGMFMDRVPLDDEGLVRYPEFMAQFDTQGRAKSLFADQSQYEGKPHKSIGALPADPTPLPRSPEAKKSYKPIGPLPHDPTPIPGLGQETIQEESESIDDYYVDVAPKRKPPQIFTIIKGLLKRDYQAVEETFHLQDELNTGRLTQENMFKLLKKFSLNPPITRGEIADLWKTFITNSDNTLDFLQFTRHFGYSLKSATYPNAKVCPPRKGDSDFMMRSRKLNCAADMLMDQLRSKVEYRLEDIGQEFTNMDNYATGCVSLEEFRALLSEMCIHLSEYELQILAKKFSVSDGRVSYVEFMKPFISKRQVWRHGNNMLSLLQHPQANMPLPEIATSPQHGLINTTNKLKQQLTGDWRTLRKAFKNMDKLNTGYVSLKEFRSVLELCNVILDEEDWFQLMSYFDKDLTGKVPYNNFVNESVKPATSRGAPSRASTMMS